LGVSANCREEAALSALLEVVKKDEVVVAALPEQLCPMAAALAAVRGATVLTWSCPHVEAAKGMVQLVPGVAARAAALVKLHRLFRWKRVSLVESDADEWSHLQAGLLQLALRAEGVDVRHRVNVGGVPGPLLDHPHSQGKFLKTIKLTLIFKVAGFYEHVNAFSCDSVRAVWIGCLFGGNRYPVGQLHWKPPVVGLRAPFCAARLVHPLASASRTLSAPQLAHFCRLGPCSVKGNHYYY